MQHLRRLVLPRLGCPKATWIRFHLPAREQPLTGRVWRASAEMLEMTSWFRKCRLGQQNAGHLDPVAIMDEC